MLELKVQLHWRTGWKCFHLDNVVEFRGRNTWIVWDMHKLVFQVLILTVSLLLYSSLINHTLIQSPSKIMLLMYKIKKYIFFEYIIKSWTTHEYFLNTEIFVLTYWFRYLLTSPISPGAKSMKCFFSPHFIGIDLFWKLSVLQRDYSYKYWTHSWRVYELAHGGKPKILVTSLWLGHFTWRHVPFTWSWNKGKTGKQVDVTGLHFARCNMFVGRQAC